MLARRASRFESLLRSPVLELADGVDGWKGSDCTAEAGTDYKDLKELALNVSTDADHRFELAISLNDLETALSLVRAAPEAGSQAKWKIVGDKALSAWQMDLAQESFEKAGDLAALLLLYTSLSDRAGMQRLATSALEKGANNIAFAAYLQLGDADNCVDLLANTGRLSEAALFARTYAPGKTAEVVRKWKAELEEQGRGKVAETIAGPEDEPDAFPHAEGSSSAQRAQEQEQEQEEHRKGDSEGSGVMVEKPDEEAVEPTPAAAPTAAPAAAPTAEDEDEDKGKAGGIKDKAKELKEKVKEKVVEPVEGLVDKVKDMNVGNGHGKSAPSCPFDR